jgi:hypothetical protein
LTAAVDPFREAATSGALSGTRARLSFDAPVAFSLARPKACRRSWSAEEGAFLVELELTYEEPR